VNRRRTKLKVFGLPADVAAEVERGRESLRFLLVALGAASELRYLVGLANRIGALDPAEIELLEPRCADLVRALHALLEALPR
jgi:four helix bundle protein